MATAISAVDYWNAHLEHNALRSPPHGRGPDTDAGAFLAWQLEATGDIIRELGHGQYADSNYIFEKFNRLNSHLTGRDWTDPLSDRENEALLKIRADIEGMPADTELLRTIKVIMIAIAERKPRIIESHLDKLRNQLKLMPQTKAGTCYEDAWRFVIKEEEGYLIHGTVLTDGKRIGHAWVETLTGYIWEPQTKKFYFKTAFKKIAEPIEESRYTPEQAGIMAARTKHFGPWTDDERRRYFSQEKFSLKPKPKIISKYPTGSITVTHGTAIVTGRFQRKGEMEPGQVEPLVIATAIERGTPEDTTEALKEVGIKLRGMVKEVEDEELLKEIEPTIRVTIPPEREKYPLVLSIDDFKRDWEPKGWKIIFIGPTSTWRQEWGEWEAIRDLVQNALDETEAYQWGYDNEGFWISDKGKGVAVADFLLGPPKLKPDYARGKFGEGMKISSLALLRAGYNVHVETVGRELWMVFIEQEADGKVQSLSALWKPDGAVRGTKFRILGYFGSSYEDRFAVNLPKSAIVAQAPSLIVEPVQRYNQLIQLVPGLEFPDGNRIYARDIYMRPINSPFSYNLWGFDMAPDRFGPLSEDDVWRDMGRLWACVKDVKLLEVFLQMKSDPPIIETDETHKLTMIDYQMGRNPVTKDSYGVEVMNNKAAWLEAWKNIFGEDAVLRTNADWDAIIKHLGYRSVSMAHGVTSTLEDAIPWDRKIIDESQERLREVKVVPDGQLSESQLAHLELARAIAGRIAAGEYLGNVSAALIPPASDRVRTAGMYGRTTREIFIHVEQLFHGRSTVDTVIHELAHHTSGAEDGEERHNLEMTRVAGDVVSMTASGAFDDQIKAHGFKW